MKIKTYMDYVDQVSKKFPDVPIQDIRRILRYGWSQYLSYNKLGCDIDIHTSDFQFLTGRIPLKRFKQYKLYQQKLARKLRVMFKKKKLKWDGYYYFCINRNKYNEDFLPQIKGDPNRPKRGITFYNVTLYKLLDECKAKNTFPKYIFRVPYIDDFGYSLYLKEYTPHVCECIGFFPSWKFYDLLIARKQYDILNGNYAKHV